jgi:hypothetical protein
MCQTVNKYETKCQHYSVHKILTTAHLQGIQQNRFHFTSFVCNPKRTQGLQLAQITPIGIPPATCSHCHGGCRRVHALIQMDFNVMR